MKNLKQNLAFMLLLAILVSFVPVIDANAESVKLSSGAEEKLKNAIVLFVGSSKSIVNGQYSSVDSTNLEVKPIIINSRTLVPVRFISEALGAKVDWDGNTSTITVTSNDKVIKLKLGNKSININGNNHELEVAAQSINGRTFIPLRALSDALGKQLFYDRGLIIISDVDKILDNTKDKVLIDEIIDLFTGQGSEIENPSDLNISKPNNRTNQIKVGRHVVQNGDWIYYVTLDKFTFHLYKMKEDGSNKKVLNQQWSYDIVLEGDYIYLKDGIEGHLTRIKTDGTDKTKIVTDKSYDINLAGDWIYYKNSSDDNKVYKVKKDGTQRTKINNRSSKDVTVVGEWIYYIDDIYNNSKIYRMKTDGTDVNALTEVNAREFRIDGEWIYFIEISPNHDYGDICKIKLDGTEKTVLAKSAAFDIRVSGDWVYYTQHPDVNKWVDGGDIYKIKKDGTEKTLLVEGINRLEDVAENWIYYEVMHRIDGSNIYSVFHRVKLDGSNVQEIGF
ncbi:DUF5050 domain-containing protein [Tepidibacter aestuarii]|uniref:DUF5050 domain-containing protein n=1 Tax=Tepidibacter aestuarii TaxID=2925782 RepID=UPI0020BD5739|nr:DUF5050 domain-containing protein [Tepidibacter aestuarii]CAH2214825.1 conserved exported protein of unknown function [Tepidibacter aestuarii]